MKDAEDILYIVMPAYNEGDNIVETVESWIPVLKGKSNKSRLVIADSGSTDNTHDLLTALKKKYSQLEILTKTNQYHGPKVIALYKYAIKNGANYIFQTDSDGQTNPDEFDAFWQDRKRFDAVLGHRNKRGDGKIRAMVERVVCGLLRLFFSVRVPDANAPFRLMRSNLVAKYIDRIPDEYDLPNIILTAYFARFNEKITFKTVSFKPRVAGTNSINLKKIFRIGKESLANFLKFRKDMEIMDPKNAKEIRCHKWGTILICASFIGAALLAISTSPSSPWNRGVTVTDSGVFLTVGTQMNSGLTPYLDTFDHKGPLLYIINYLGVLINPTSGILVFEFIALFVTIVYLFKTSRLFVGKRLVSWFLTMIVFSLYFALNVIDRGNLTEEYALPFVAMALYEFLKYLIKEKTSLFRIFMVGVGFACVLMLRVNMVAIWGVFGLAIVFELLYKKKWLDLGKFMLSFLCGVLIVIIPILGWLLAKGAFQSFIDVYFVFNATYAAKDGSVGGIYSAIEYFFGYTLLLVGWLSAGYIALTKENRRNKFSFCVLFIAFSVAIVASCVSGRQYPHYGMVLIPFPVVALSIIYERSIKSQEKMAMVVFSIILILLSYQFWFKVFGSAISSFTHRKEGEVVADFFKKACDYVDSETQQGDRIAVYGNLNYIYLRCNRLPASRYSYQFPISLVRPSILDEFFEDVKNDGTKVFIVQGGYVDKKVTTFLEDNHYSEVWRDGGPKENNTSRIYLLGS